MKIGMSIPTSSQVAHATNSGEPIISAQPKHSVSSAISSLAKDLSEPAPAADRQRLVARHPGRHPSEAIASPSKRQVTHEQSRRPAGRSLSRPVRRPASTDAMAPGKKVERRSVEETKVENDFRDLKGTVHNRLLQQLGPKLYDAELTQSELEHMVRGALQDAMQDDEILLTAAERTRIAQEISDDILGYGPIEPFLRDPDITEVMVNGAGPHLRSSAAGGCTRSTGTLHRRGAPAPHDRQDRRPHRPSRRRVQPDGGRPPARRLPRQRRHPAAGPRRLAAHDPQVLRGPLHGRRPGRASAPTPSARPSSWPPACRAGSTSSSPAAPAPARRPRSTCCPSFIPSDERIITIEDAAELQLHQDHVLRLESRPPNIEGKGAGRHPRPGAQLPAHAARPHRRRRGPRRRGARHAAGDEHRSRRLDLRPCTPTRRATRCARLETMVLMAGMDLPIRAIREQVASRDRPDRAPEPAARRLPADHPRHRGRAAWRAT